MGWTDDRVATLRKLWAEGLSASQIAKQLGGVTRNAVIGKVHRLGLAGRATPSRPAKRPVRPARPRTMGAPSAPRLRPATHANVPAIVVPELEPLRFDDGRAASVLTIKDSMCKYPIGDPSTADFAFCGRESNCGPYCQDHARLAYQPSQAKKRRIAEPDELRRMQRLSAM